MEKDEILNSNWAVRSSAAGNPNTPGYTSSNEEFIIAETYVAIKGTNHLWYNTQLSQCCSILYMWLLLWFPRTVDFKDLLN